MRALAELVRAGRPARLLMVGGKVGASDPTNQAYLEHVERLAVDLGVADRVQWTGFTSSDQVSANLLAADCAVLPYHEGATLRHGSLMAALAHGLPIASTLTSAGVETDPGLFPMLRDGESALLVPPEDPVRLADAVERVMIDPELRLRLAQGREPGSRNNSPGMRSPVGIWTYTASRSSPRSPVRETERGCRAPPLLY